MTATWETSLWEPAVESGVPRADRRRGAYRRYVPGTLEGAAVAVRGDLARQAAAVERKIRLLHGAGAEGLGGIARFLLRSEAIASSRIEGIAPSAQQIALAELGQSESVRGISEQARLVAANMTVVRRSTTELVAAESLTLDHVLELHRALLVDQPQHHGLRRVQNWIGGSDWSPLDADFVPPGPEQVPALMADLVSYLNGAAHSSLIQAALAHAQFETVHPFTDGNGRVGRALIHTVLARGGLTPQAVLPISLVLATLRSQYVSGLSAYRYDSEAGGSAAEAVHRWLEVFLGAADVAVDQSANLARQVADLRADWASRLSEHRLGAGLRPSPRADSAVARLLSELPEAPVVTTTTLSRILDVSFPAASAALDELRQAGIVTTVVIERGAKAFVAREVLDLVTLTERALASTKFDTRSAPPSRPVPASPAAGLR